MSRVCGCGWCPRRCRAVAVGSRRRCGRRAVAAVDGLADIDLSALDAGALREWLVGVEQVRRMVDAVGVTAAGHVDRCNPFRDQGFFTAKTAVKHMAGLSGPEAFRRVQTARMHAGLPVWADAHTDGSGRGRPVRVDGPRGRQPPPARQRWWNATHPHCSTTRSVCRSRSSNAEYGPGKRSPTRTVTATATNANTPPVT